MTDPLTSPGPWRSLEQWYLTLPQLYPWSGYTDPYPVWVSETMLQQTTVRTVARRFAEWLELFPDAPALASASEAEVLRAWEGLGYYSRARRLREAAGHIKARGWPETPEAWQKLPGVGPYVAAAVSSFTKNTPVFAFDANLKRIFLRLENLESWNSGLEKTWKQRAPAVFAAVQSSRVNSALMRLGQEVCLPQKPRCGDCPLSTICKARVEGTQNNIPAPPVKKAVVEETLYPQFFLRFQQQPELFLTQSTQSLFQGQWMPPLGSEGWWESYPGALSLSRRKHLVTHHRWTLQPWAVKGWEPREEGGWHPARDWEKIPVPSVYRKILRELTLSLPLLFG